MVSERASQRAFFGVSALLFAASATPSGKAAIPNTVHTKKYPTTTSAVSRPRRVSPVLPTAWR